MPKLNKATVTPTTVPSNGDGREEQLAINLHDLDRLDSATRARLVSCRIKHGAPFVDLRGDDKRGSEVAVAFACVLLEAATVCDLIRGTDRQVGDTPTRVYLKRRAWVKLPADAVLTRPDGAGGVMLDPVLFPPTVTAAGLASAAPPVQVVVLGRSGRGVPVATKVAYVKRQSQTRDHHCHWPGCGKQVPPAMWGCKTHWFKLPKHLRDRIWATFRPGQETNWTPSREYLEAAHAVQEWIKANIPAPA